MAVFKVNINDIKNEEIFSGGSQFITKSGLYDIEIVSAFVRAKDKQQSLWIKYAVNGTPSNSFLFVRLTNNNGEENFEKLVFDKIAAMKGVTELSTTKKKVKFKETETTEDCFVQLEGLKIKVWIREEFTKYNGQIYQKFAIKEVFDSKTNLTAQEKLDGIKEPNRFLALEATGIFDKQYSKGVTDEEIKEFKSQFEKNKVENKQSQQVSNPFAMDSNDNIVDNDEIPF